MQTKFFFSMSALLETANKNISQVLCKIQISHMSLESLNL